MPELVCAATDSAWPDERRKGVTATDITAVIGISSYESAWSLYHKKLGTVPDDHTDNNRLRLGRELEPLIVQRWWEQNGETALDPLMANCLWRSESRPWQLATPDHITCGPNGERTGVLELKSWADADKPAWAKGPPPVVRAQVLWQMDTLDVARGHVGVLFLPSGEFRSYVISHGSAVLPLAGGYCSDGCEACKDIFLMRSAARDFLDRIDLRVPPPLDGSSATLAALRARYVPHKGKEAEIDPELWTIWSEWKDAEDSAGNLAKTFEAKIREQLGEATILIVGGVKVATRIVSDAHVKAHTRRNDYIRRTPKEKDQ